MNKIFVYGILRDCYDYTPATLNGYKKFYRTHATIVEDIESKVEGQLIEVDENEFRNIDRIEGNGSYYWRFETTCNTTKGNEDCWVYQQIMDKSDI
jgi:gamma-glutamylcyclotransferase (GGCT)/AIG2-like uncharacterized protein YtfP